MRKRGLSTVVTSLILILLVLVAVGIVWVVVKNVISSGAESVFLDKFTVSLKMKDVTVTSNNIAMNVKRNPGEGDLIGIKFIFDYGTSSETVENDSITLNELGELSFDFTPSDISNPDEVKTISIAPIYRTSSGKKVVGNIVDTYKVTAQIATQLCETDLGGDLCTFGDLCQGGSWIQSAEGNQVCCYGGTCTPCTPDTPSQACTTKYGSTYECGTAPVGCGLPDVNCGSDTCENLHATGWQCDYSTGQCYLPVTPCTLGQPTWNPTVATEGDIVLLIVPGTNCDGKELSFVVWEDDTSSSDDPVTTEPANVFFSGNTATGNWTAEWQTDTSGDPEYYFIASVVGGTQTAQSSTSQELTVAQAAQPCDLVSASWSSSSVQGGTQVTLTALGTNCIGEAITFDIYEDDGLVGDDYVTTMSNNYGSTSVTTTWTTTWTYSGDDDGFNNNPRNYYFDATVDSNGDSVTSSNLQTTTTNCVLTSATWNPTVATEGDIVSLILQGTNCAGKTISFEVWEDDTTSSDDPVVTNPANIVFSGGSSSGTWTAEWQSDASGDPEYYFIASVVGEPGTIQSSTSQELTVAQAAQPCDLTSASWSSSSVPDGTLVTLSVAGTNCAGDSITFDIYEDDPFSDDLVTTLNNPYSSTTWTATWTYAGDDDSGTDPRDYYFRATSDSSGDQVTSSNLEVSRPLGTCSVEGGEVCGSGEYCTSSFIPASDTTSCCPLGDCAPSSCNTCADCDDFFGTCSYDQCHNSCGGGPCYFRGNVIGEDCVTQSSVCGSSVTQCEDYSDEECTNDPCGLAGNCVFEGSSCITAPPSYVIRTLPLSVGGGNSVTVNMDIYDGADENIVIFEERIPSGWTVTSNNFGGNTPDPQILRFYIVQSIPINDEYHLAYDVTAPTSTGLYNFDGIYFFDVKLVTNTNCGNGDCEWSNDQSQKETDPTNYKYCEADCQGVPIIGNYQIQVN